MSPQHAYASGIRHESIEIISENGKHNGWWRVMTADGKELFSTSSIYQACAWEGTLRLLNERSRET